ncbi:hypothetical protein U8335_15810 [Roseiconus lacunae]|uniref:hypothetical protein n=1 Tax=Roseiconus lacunae TaxID=2605694 RepID=UPI0030934148|nr:hypothetical protein U8335_15810 [Stieleria sp. HD01]
MHKHAAETRSRALTVLVLIALTHINTALGQENHRADLKSVLRLATVHGEAMCPFDVSMVTHIQNEFDGEPTDLQVIRSRMLYSPAGKFLSWAVETKKENSQSTRRPESVGAVTYYGVTVHGSESTSITGDGSPSIRSHKSFSAALNELKIPRPEYWLILPFPFQNGDAEIERLASLIDKKSSTITSTVQGDSIRYQVRVEREGGHYDLFGWSFDVETLHPSRCYLKRAMGGPPTTYFEQDVRWGTAFGKEIPVLIAHQKLALRPAAPGSRVQLELGIRNEDTELNWHKVVENKEKLPRKILQSKIDVVQFLDEH